MAKKEAPSGRGGRCILKKVAITLCVVLLFYIVSSAVATAIVPSVLYGRSELGADSLEMRYSDIDAARYPRREVSFTSGGNTLRGYIYGEADARGVVLIVHGINAGADTHLPETLWFLDHGWAVFTFDGTGTRESGGSGTVGLSRLKLDLIDAVACAEAEKPDVPLVLYGHSLGAYSAAAVLDDCPEICAAVLIAGFNSPMETMMYHARARVGVLADMEYPFLALQNYLTFGDEGDEKAVVSINAGDTPVLLVYGTEDETVPREISLYARRGEIVNPNAEYMLISEEYRSGHSAIWLSRSAAEYLDTKSAELTELHAKYGAVLPENVLGEFRAGLDSARLYELDEGFMSAVLEFYNAAALNEA